MDAGGVISMMFSEHERLVCFGFGMVYVPNRGGSTYSKYSQVCKVSNQQNMIHEILRFSCPLAHSPFVMNL